MFYKLTSSLLLTLLIFASGFSNRVASAQEAEIFSQKPRQGQPGGQRQRLFEQLNLTPDQEQEIKRIRQKNRPQMQNLREQIRSRQTEMQTLMAGNGSEAQLKAKHQQIVQLRQEMGNLHFNNMLEIRQVLTPAQRNQLADLMEQRRPRCGGGPGLNEPFGSEEL